MSGVICYVAPSVVASLDEQIAAARQVVTREDWIRVDRPVKQTGPVPRQERDFVIDHLLRGGDKLWVYSLDVLGDSRAEILDIFRALHGVGVPVISQDDGLDGDMEATRRLIALDRALTRAESRIERREAVRNPRRRTLKAQKTGGRPKALRPAEIDEAMALRAEGKTWAQIAAHFKAAGVDVGLTALRDSCSARRATSS